MEQIYDYYTLSRTNTDLIKGLSTSNNELVKNCLEEGAEPNMVVQLDMITGSGNRVFIEMFTPLLLALKYKNEKAVRLLHSFGARPNELLREFLSNYEEIPGDLESLEILRLAKLF